MVDRIVEVASPVRILLFGSRARGDAKDNSDIDFIVMLPTRDKMKEVRVEILASLGGLGFAKDVLVTTPEYFAGASRTPGHLFRRAAEETKVLYDREV